MSTIVPAGPPVTLDVTKSPRTPFVRLVKVELRKMIDTRSGLWLMLVTGLLLALTVAIVLLVIGLNDDVSIGANAWSQILTFPLSLLLPVFAILTITSEWSQRTALITFTLEPHRAKVLAAKACTVFVLALSTIVVAMVLGAIGNLVGAAISGVDTSWDIPARDLTMLVVVQLLYFLMAFSLATLILNTPGAIAIFYVVALMLPVMVYGALYAIFEWARDVIPWIDLQYSTAPFLDPAQDIGVIDVARLATTIVIWIVVPLGLGTRRVLRAEAK